MNLKQYTLTYVKNEDKVSKNGKPYTSTSIKVMELGDVFINGFGNRQTLNWNANDKVMIEIYEEEYNGKTYKKFKAPHPNELFEQRIAKLEAAVFGDKGEDVSPADAAKEF